MDWEKKKLGEVIELEYGKGLPKRERNTEGSYPVYGSNGIVGWHTDYLIEGPCLIVGRKGAVGKIHLSKNNCWPIDTTYYVKPTLETKLEFLLYLLKSLYLESLDKSTAIPGLNRNDAYELEINLPPLLTQHRIVEKIEELFSDLDNGVENLKKARQQLETYRQAVLKAAFEGKLTKQWREQQEDLPSPEELRQQIEEERKRQREKELEAWRQEVKEWKKQGEKGRKPRKPSKLKKIEITVAEENVDQFPQVWPSFDLDSVAEIIMGQSPPGSSYNTEGKGVPLINGPVEFGPHPFSKTIKSKWTTEPTSKFCKEGDLILCVRGSTTGRMNIAGFKACLGRGVAAIRAYGDYQKYINHFINKIRPKILRIGTGSTFPSVSSTQIKNLVIPFPSFKEQNKIIELIEAQLSVIEQTNKTIDDEFQKAEALRQSILKKAFSGELVSEVPAKILEFQKSPQKYYVNKPTDLHAALMCKIIDAHYKNEKHLKKLNHVKCEKIIHMLESHEGIELEREPVKDAAGPDDFPKLKKIEHRARAKNWFQIDKSLGGKYGYGYKPKRSLEYPISNLEKIEGLPLEAIDKIIDLFLKMDKERAEIVATLYAAWNNFLIDGHQPSDEEIVRAAREEWSKQKLNIKRERFFKALQWMRKKKLIPSGLGKRVKEKTG